MNKDMSKILDFSNKTVLITGSTRGIGKDLAIAFANAGANVIAHGRNPKLLLPLAKKIKATPVQAELSSETEIQDMIQELCKKEQKIDVLINNAGFEINRPYEQFSMEEYDRVMNINIRSVFQLTKGLFPLLKKSKEASIINVSSIHQTLAYPNNLPYCMSKAAMEMFCKVVAVEWAPYNIRVNSLAPGAISTDMNKEILDNIGRGKFSSWIGSGKIGTTMDVVYACFFLGSRMSSYMTGETLYIDGALSKGLLPYGRTVAMTKMTKDLLKKDKK